MAATKTGFRSGRNDQAVQENIELLTGQRGTGLDRAVTLRDLATASLATIKKSTSGTYSISGSASSSSSSSSAVSLPTAPTGFSVTGGFSTILLRWDKPTYSGHSYTEIWRGTVETFTDAILLSTTPATVIGDVVSPGSSFYYWVRHVNTNNVAGAYNATLGTLGQTSVDVADVIEEISEQMRTTSLITSLLASDDTFAQAIANIQQSQADDNSVISATINQLTATYTTQFESQSTENQAQLTEMSAAIAQVDDSGGEAFKAMWAVKATAGEITAGIGILADSDGTSQVAISASQLFVFDPNTEDSLTPLLAVNDGAVTIQTALIEQATVNILSAQEITADYLKAGVSLETPTINSAVINGAQLNIGVGGDYNGYHTQITAEGVIYTDALVASGGFLDNVIIKNNCIVRGLLDGADGTFSGTVFAQNIEGDIVDVGVMSLDQGLKTVSNSSTFSWSIGSCAVKNTTGRQAKIIVGSISVKLTGEYTGSAYNSKARIIVSLGSSTVMDVSMYKFISNADANAYEMVGYFTMPGGSITVADGYSGTLTCTLQTSSVVGTQIQAISDCVVQITPVGGNVG